MPPPKIINDYANNDNPNHPILIHCISERASKNKGKANWHALFMTWKIDHTEVCIVFCNFFCYKLYLWINLLDLIFC